MLYSLTVLLLWKESLSFFNFAFPSILFQTCRGLTSCPSLISLLTKCYYQCAFLRANSSIKVFTELTPVLFECLDTVAIGHEKS